MDLQTTRMKVLETRIQDREKRIEILEARLKTIADDNLILEERNKALLNSLRAFEQSAEIAMLALSQTRLWKEKLHGRYRDEGRYEME
ncbi:hypothetical protein VNI00_002492 [Paramarasmius palmivorus]|uniref:Uncharacterized protein n=1 Tax=Paramarasmius palmivorus TaxID=297713 RepID=A0AAW0E1G0_9AGAR